MSSPRWLIAVPVVAALVAAALAPWGTLVWDDHNFFREMALFTSFRHLFEPPLGFFTPLLYFRPVYYLSYLVDHRIWGAESIAGPHITNLVVHLAVVALVFTLLRRLLGARPHGQMAATLAATLFAVHPVHAENVSWIAGRADMIAALWLVAALLLLLSARDRRSPARLAGAMVLLSLALLSKEVAVAGLAIAPALMLLVPPAGAAYAPAPAVNWRLLDWWWAGLVAVLVLVLFLGYLRLRALFGADIDLGELNFAAERLEVLLRVAGWYLLRLVYPGSPALVVAPNLLPATGLAAGVLALTVLLGLWSLGRLRVAGDGIALLGLGWIAITLAPSFTIPLTDLTPRLVAALVAERYLYVPSVGLAILLGAVLAARRPGRWRLIWAGACGVAAVLGLGLSLQRSVMWLDEIRVWESVVEQQPDDGLPWFQLGRARQEVEDFAGAETDYLQGLSLESTPVNRATAFYSLGNLALRRGDLTSAEERFRAALREAPTQGLAHYGLGNVYHQLGRRSRNPQERLRWFTRGRVAYETGGRFKLGAVELDLQVIRLLADRAEALDAAGRSEEAGAERVLAASMFKRIEARVPALATDPALGDLRNRLARSSTDTHQKAPDDR